MPKWRLGQLLEEPLTDLGKEDRNLIFIVLLLETCVIKQNERGSPGERRELAVIVPWLLLLPFALPANFPT